MQCAVPTCGADQLVVTALDVSYLSYKLESNDCLKQMLIMLCRVIQWFCQG